MPIEKLRPSFTLDEDRIEELRRVVPEAFADGQIDWETLRELLDDHVAEEEEERFGLFWPGKRKARRLASEPSQGTLVPAPGEGVNGDSTHNAFIEGDNLEVLKLLQKSYADQVKLIYIDPPYNTGQDFIYEDDYSEPLHTYLENLGQLDDEGAPLTSNTKSSGRFHSNWLNMMYPRLVLARQLLKEDGVIMVSIDDNELQNLRMLMDEVFGEPNFIATVIWQKVFAPKNSARHFSVDHDYVLIYAADAEAWRPNLLPRSEEADSRYSNPDDDPRGPWASDNLLARNYYSKGRYEVTSPSGEKYTPPSGNYWRVSEENFEKLDDEDRIWWGEDGSNMPRLKRFLSEVKDGVVPQTLWTYEEVGHTQEAKKELLAHVEFQNTENVLNTVKPTRLIERILHVSTDADSDDIVLDFFAGSAPTAHATLLKNKEDGGNRRYIMVQIPQPLPKPEDEENMDTIADIGKERIRSVGAEIRKENDNVDVGFRCYKLSESNYRTWDDYEGTEVGEIESLFDRYETPLVDDWERGDLLVEVLLMQGYPLDSNIEELSGFDRNDVFKVTTDLFSSRLFVCLDEDIADETINSIDVSTNDSFVCLDSALTDEAKMRLQDATNLKVI